MFSISRYLDTVVYDLQEHNARLVEILYKLRQHKLKLQSEKCEFLRKEIIYLGHVIIDNRIKSDPTKLKAISEFIIPVKIKEIQAFIGLVGYYRKFIENFFKIAKLLTKLTKKGEPFV